MVGEPEVLMEGIVFGESPRWHDGRLWFSDWGANQVIALGPGGPEVVVTVASFPLCIDFLPDGRLLVVDSAQRRFLPCLSRGRAAGRGGGNDGHSVSVWCGHRDTSSAARFSGRAHV